MSGIRVTDLTVDELRTLIREEMQALAFKPEIAARLEAFLRERHWPPQ